VTRVAEQAREQHDAVRHEARDRDRVAAAARQRERGDERGIEQHGDADDDREPRPGGHADARYA
jgi:hypothetical protein